MLKTTSVTIDVSIESHERLWDDWGGVGETVVVAETMFGAITTNKSFNEFQADFEYVSGTMIRWPGGTLAENGGVDPNTGTVHTNSKPGDEPYYSLDYPGLIHPNATSTGSSSLGDLFEYSCANELQVSIIVPVSPYYDDPHAAYDAMLSLLEDIYVEGLYGEVPHNLMFDIGNEQYDSIEEYAAVTLEILLAVSDFREDFPTTEFLVGIQSMSSGTDSQTYADALSSTDLAVPYQNLLSEVDVVRQHALQLNLGASEDQGAANFEESRYYRSDPLVDSVMVASGGDAPEIYFSAWSTNNTDVIDMTTGLPAASSMMSVFTGMLELGAEYAAVWGLDTGPQNDTVMSYDGEDGERIMSPTGEVFRMMAESLIGTTLIDTSDLDNNRNDPYQMFVFADDAKTVIFVSPNAFEGDEYSITFEIENFGEISHVWTESLNTNDLTLNGELIPPQENREAISLNDDGTFTITFEQPYEMVRIIVSNNTPGDGRLHLWGGEDSETLFGGNADDLLEGNGGSDTLVGGTGNDKLFGGQGDDLIKGGEGDDEIRGNDGDDRLLGGQGNDIIGLQDGGEFDEGANGNDFACGGAGFDSVMGGSGNDFIAGGTENDRLWGEDGNDVLVGGNGDDLLSGGTGEDIFVFYDFGAHEVDLIQDFEIGEDQIRVLNGPVSLTAMEICDVWIDGTQYAQIQYDEHIIHMSGVASSELSESDFLFS